MLEIYYVYDEEEFEDPPAERRVAGLEMEHHRALCDLWPIAESEQVGLGYFEDSRIDHQGVKRLMALLGSMKEIDKSELKTHAYAKLKIGLQCALDKGAGILSICD